MENVEWKRFRTTNYFISNNGIVRNGKNGKNKILKPALNKDGYERVDLCFGSRSGVKHFTIHRMVAECFLRKIKGKDIVNHKDFDKRNNHYSNLEWCTVKENSDHFFNSDLAPLGENCSQSKFTNAEVIRIKKMLKAGRRSIDIAAMFNVHRSTISKIEVGKNWASVQ